MAEECKILAFGKRNTPQSEISKRDRLRANEATRLRTGEAIQRLLKREKVVTIPELPVFFGDAKKDSGIVLPSTHPKIGDHILVDEKAADWLVDKGIEEPEVIDYLSVYISALSYVHSSMRSSYHTVRQSLGFEPERWPASHPTPITALSHRAAATVALDASTDISSDIRRAGLFNQPPHIAAIMNPIEPYEFPQLSSVLQ